MAESSVYWITGLSGAGKTTIGRILFDKLRASRPNTVFLDGDELREVFGGAFGYTEAERRRCAMSYSKLCSMLSRQGVNVVICTISMFDEVRAWNRDNIPGYIEVYVRVSMDVLRERDSKNIYSAASSGALDDVYGVSLRYEEPKSPDIIIENDGSTAPEILAQRILDDAD